MKLIWIASKYFGYVGGFFHLQSKNDPHFKDVSFVKKQDETGLFLDKNR